MKVITLNNDYLESFKAYCYKYRFVHDESFLYDDDINTFKVSENDPTYLLLDGEKIIGCLSLMIDEYYLASKKTRVRIFHCEDTVRENYQALLESVLPVDYPIDRLEMFMPNKLVETQEILKSLDFSYYRTSFVMIRKDKEQIRASFPENYTLKPFVRDKDEEAYAFVRNTAFKNIKGSETPISKELVIEYYEEKLLLKEGMKILWFEDKPVGIIRMLHEPDETGDYSFVAPIALIREQQRKGLGKELLKAGIEIGQKNGFNDCMLVVNAENDNALSLYKKVGFEVDMAISCFTLELSKHALKK